MQGVTLATLARAPLAIVVSKKDAQPFRPGKHFLLPVVLTNNGDRSIEWAREKPLHLSYRWLDEHGSSTGPEGLRTTIPISKLEPGARVEVELGGSSPEYPGMFELQVSLVLEGVHWACDIGSAGWDKREVIVIPVPAWPTEFKDSRGARALRGAILANELSRLLGDEKFAKMRDVAATAVPPENLGDAGSERSSRLAKLRGSLRKALGVDGLERQLSSVHALVNRQDEHARGLEQQIILLREQLLADLKPAEVRAPQFQEDLSRARKRVRAYLAGQGILPVSRNAQTGNPKKTSLKAAKRNGRSAKPTA